MYFFKYCVYHSSKASMEHHWAHMPDQEVRKLSSPPTVMQDNGSNPAACPAPWLGPQAWSCRRHGAAAASGNETENGGVPSPTPAVPGSWQRSPAPEWSLPLIFWALAPCTQRPLGDLASSLPCCWTAVLRSVPMGKVTTALLLPMAHFSISHIIAFSLFSQGSAAPVLI